MAAAHLFPHRPHKGRYVKSFGKATSNIFFGSLSWNHLLIFGRMMRKPQMCSVWVWIIFLKVWKCHYPHFYSWILYQSGKCHPVEWVWPPKSQCSGRCCPATMKEVHGSESSGINTELIQRKWLHSDLTNERSNQNPTLFCFGSFLGQ